MTNPTNLKGLVRAIGWTVFATTSMGQAQSSVPDTPPAQAAVDTPPAESGAAQTAASIFWEGKRKYDSGEFEQARDRFELAYRLVQDPSLLYNIAQSYRQLGDCSKAKLAYRQFREAAPDSPLIGQAEGHLADLEQLCPTTPPPQPAPTASTAESFATPSPLAVVSQTKDTPRVSNTLKTPPEPRAGHARQYLTWATLAAGLVTAGTATGIGLWNRERYQQWKSRDISLDKGNAPGESDWEWAVRQQKNDELNDSIRRTGKVVAYVGVAGGALLVGSAFLFLTTPKSSIESPSARSTKPKAWGLGTILAPNDIYLSVLTTF